MYTCMNITVGLNLILSSFQCLPEGCSLYVEAAWNISAHGENMCVLFQDYLWYHFLKHLFLWQREYSWDNILGLTRRPFRWGLACFTGRGSRRVSLWDVTRNPGLSRNSPGFLCVYEGNASYKELLFSANMCDICAGFSSFILWINLNDISVVFWNLGLYTAQPIWEKFFT